MLRLLVGRKYLTSTRGKSGCEIKICPVKRNFLAIFALSLSVLCGEALKKTNRKVRKVKRKDRKVLGVIFDSSFS